MQDMPTRYPIALALVLVTVAVHPVPAQTPSPALDEEALGRIDAAMASLDGGDRPGCAVGAERAGRVALTRAYGMANLEHAVPITAATVFEAGSISKQFTAAAVLLLADEGALDLEEDVRAYVPELPDYGEKITVDHLLTHTSGLRDWGTLMFFAGWPRGDRVYTNATALEIIFRQPSLNHAPGAWWSYTNSGYVLLAEIVERVSGRSLPELTRERIFEPLGMRSTRWREDYRAVVPDRATAYEAGGGGFVMAMPFEHTYGHAGLLTTVEDLLRWNAALDDGWLPGGALMQEAGTGADGTALPYGRGLFVGTHRGTPEISHGGTTAGYRGWLARYPDQAVSVAVLCNGPADPTRLGHVVAGELLSAPAPVTAEASAEPAGEPVDSAVAAALAGVFARAHAGTPFTVAERDGTLYISGQRATALGDRRFRISWGEFRFETPDLLHELNADGSVFESFHRVSRPGDAAMDTTGLAGRYASAETLATYRVRVEGGRLAIQVEDRPAFVLMFDALGPNVYRSTGTLVHVDRDARGRVEAIRLSTDRLRDLRLTPIR